MSYNYYLSQAIMNMGISLHDLEKYDGVLASYKGAFIQEAAVPLKVEKRREGQVSTAK